MLPCAQIYHYVRWTTDKDWLRGQSPFRFNAALPNFSKVTMSKTKLIPFALLAFTQSIFAQPIPNAGSQMQQLPPATVPQKLAPQVEIKPGIAPAQSPSDSARLRVNALRVTGAQAYSQAELLALTGFRPGTEQSLTDLRAMAARIADHYHRNGYFVAQAYLPAQDIKDGVVTIAVMEGRFGKVTLNNQTNVSNGLANNLLGGLQSGDPVVSRSFETPLLLLSDLPGVVVKSTLVPGASAGESDLMVDMTPGPRVNGSIDADNAGNHHTGKYRLGATVNYNEPLGLGDVASLRVLTSGRGLNYARGSYQMQFGKATAGVALSALRYELGEEFESLDANGTAKVASVYGSYPLIRTRNNNLTAGLVFDAKKFQDNVDSTGQVTHKKAQVLTASLSGNHRDSLGGGGYSAYSLGLSTGNIDHVTAQTSNHFNKLALSALRLQRVTDSISLYGAINGQVASTNLDSSEKMGLGGMYGVRAYPQGEAFADEGYLINLEARMRLPKFSEKMPGQLELIGFVDTGTVRLAKNPDPLDTGSNRRTLSGAGVGVNWTVSNSFVMKAYYARKIGDEVATSAPDASGRFWIQAVKYF